MWDKTSLGIGLICILSGCVSLKFTDGAPTQRTGGVLFYDPVPHMRVSMTDKCVVSYDVVMLPDVRRPRTVTVTRGLIGKASVSFNNGLITSLSGENSVNVPDLVGRFTVLLMANDGGEGACPPMTRLYRMDPGTGGEIDYIPVELPDFG